MTIHRHHSTPQHLGGIGPIQLLEDRDHAYVHFHRFMDGEDPWFHPGLLRFLDPWDQITTREEMSRRGSGEGNTMYGVPSPVKGWSWWTDGTENVMSPDSPGPQWTRGRTGITNENKTYKTGHKVFTNGVTEVHTYKCPDGFWEGRLPMSDESKQRRKVAHIGKHWWNDGTREVFCIEQPDGFVKGRLPGQKRKRRT